MAEQQPNHTAPPHPPGDGRLRPVHLFVAMPGDLTQERREVGRVVAELNAHHGPAEQHGLVFRLLMWEEVVPDMGRGQGVIFEQMPVATWDLFIGALWKRFGSVTGARDPQTRKPYNSGTEEEFRAAYGSLQETGRPRMLFYHRTQAPRLLSDIDTSELDKVNAFIAEFRAGGRHEGLYITYGRPVDFERRVRQDLIKLLPDLAAPDPLPPETPITTRGPLPPDPPNNTHTLDWMVFSAKLELPFKHGTADEPEDAGFLLEGGFWGGHSARQRLMQDLNQDYLVYGRRGCGRTAWAKWFAGARDEALGHSNTLRVLLAGEPDMTELCRQVTNRLFANLRKQPERLQRLGEQRLLQLAGLLLTHCDTCGTLLAQIEPETARAAVDPNGGQMLRLAEALTKSAVGPPQPPPAATWEPPGQSYRHLAEMAGWLGYVRVRLILDVADGQAAWLRRLVLDRLHAWRAITDPSFAYLIPPTHWLIFVPRAMYEDELIDSPRSLTRQPLTWSAEELTKMVATRCNTFFKVAQRPLEAGLPWEGEAPIRDLFESDGLFDELIAASERRAAPGDYSPRQFMLLWRSAVKRLTYSDKVTTVDVREAIGSKSSSSGDSPPPVPTATS